MQGTLQTSVKTLGEEWAGLARTPINKQGGSGLSINQLWTQDYRRENGSALTSQQPEKVDGGLGLTFWSLQW